MALALVLTLSIGASVLAYDVERFARRNILSRRPNGKARAGIGSDFAKFVFSTLVKTTSLAERSW
jgi:hypothetical protein